MNPFAPARVLSSLLPCACGPFRAQVVPIPMIDLTPERAGRCLLMLRPGRFASPVKSRRAGFGKAVATRGLRIDPVTADAHIDDRSRSVVDRLRTDIIPPARAAGCEQVSIAGTSLGGPRPCGDIK